jgi:hypothetical protein
MLPTASAALRDACLSPWQMRMSSSNQPLYLDNPSLRLCLIAEVWDQPALSAVLNHFDANAPIILLDQPKGCSPHGR